MEIKFIEIFPNEIKEGFPLFYEDNKLFFEIYKNKNPIGFYGVKDVGRKVSEISLYINEDSRGELTKGIVEKILNIPFKIGFSKTLISTEVYVVEKFLKKIEKLGKLGVKYLFKNENLHWFEVNYGVY